MFRTFFSSKMMLSCDQRVSLFSTDGDSTIIGGYESDKPEAKRVRVVSNFVQIKSHTSTLPQETSVADLTRDCIGRGRSGSVYKITLDNKDLACKLYSTHRLGNPDRMKKELGIYQRMKSSQGILVPQIYSSVLMDGEAIGLCMTLLRPLPCRLSQWSKEDRYKAKGVLLKLADLGLFHDDIKPDNFGLTTSNRMMVFDFEDVHCSEDVPEELDLQKYTTRYKKRVCRMFKEK